MPIDDTRQFTVIKTPPRALTFDCDRTAPADLHIEEKMCHGPWYPENPIVTHTYKMIIRAMAPQSISRIYGQGDAGRRPPSGRATLRLIPIQLQLHIDNEWVTQAEWQWTSEQWNDFDITFTPPIYATAFRFRCIGPHVHDELYWTKGTIEFG